MSDVDVALNQIATESKQLPDVQSIEDIRGIPLERVGITGYFFPIKVKRKPSSDDDHYQDTLSTLRQSTSANVDLFVALPKEPKGIHMSRLAESLVEFGETSVVLSFKTMPKLLKLLKERLKSEDAYARFEFDYFINKCAPVSKRSAPMSYRCAFTGIQKNSHCIFIMEVNVIAASLCVCSREMSLLNNVFTSAVYNSLEPASMNIMEESIKQSGIGAHVGMGAHNQRSLIRAKVICHEGEMFWIEDLVSLIESSASSPTYTLLKRPDEKFVTEQAYNNAKFSEDIARDLQIALESQKEIKDWHLKVENQESIHPYNATVIQKSDNWNF